MPPEDQTQALATPEDPGVQDLSPAGARNSALLPVWLLGLGRLSWKPHIQEPARAQFPGPQMARTSNVSFEDPSARVLPSTSLPKSSPHPAPPLQCPPAGT